jgi:hypothetical protein
MFPSSSAATSMAGMRSMIRAATPLTWAVATDDLQKTPYCLPGRIEHAIAAHQPDLTIATPSPRGMARPAAIDDMSVVLATVAIFAPVIRFACMETPRLGLKWSRPHGGGGDGGRDRALWGRAVPLYNL